MIIMVDHQLCHSAVNTNILPGDETRFFRVKEHHHVRNIQWIADTAASFTIAFSTVSIAAFFLGRRVFFGSSAAVTGMVFFLFVVLPMIIGSIM